MTSRAVGAMSPVLFLNRDTSTSIASNQSFGQLCRSSRVCKAWNLFITEHLQNFLTSVRANQFLRDYEAQNLGVEIPPRIQSPKDLKRRFAAALKFCRDFKIIHEMDVARVVLFVRSTNLFKTNGRQWMGHYLSFPEMVPFEDTFKELAFNGQVNICIDRWSKGVPFFGCSQIQGLEDIHCERLIDAINCYFLFSHLCFLKNEKTSSVNSKKILKVEADLLSQDFPIYLIRNGFKENLPPNARRKLADLFWGPASSIREELISHDTKGTLTDALLQQYSKTLMDTYPKELLDLLKTIAVESSRQISNLERNFAENMQTFFAAQCKDMQPLYDSLSSQVTKIKQQHLVQNAHKDIRTSTLSSSLPLVVSCLSPNMAQIRYQMTTSFGKTALDDEVADRVIGWLSFQEICIAVRVNRSWQRVSDEHLTKCRRNSLYSGPVATYDYMVSREYLEEMPTQSADLIDLKRRFAGILHFSKEFALFKDFESVALIARCTRVFTANGRNWIAFYAMPMPFFNGIRSTLKDLAHQGRIALGNDVVVRAKEGKPIQGSYFGLEERNSLLMATAIQSHYKFSKWLSAHRSLNTEELFANLNFPFFLVQDEELQKLSRDTVLDLKKFTQDKLVSSIMKTRSEHMAKGTLTPEKERELRTQLMTKKKDEILKLLDVIAFDTANLLVQYKYITPQEYNALAHFFYMKAGNEKDQFYHTSIRPQLIRGLRNRMWVQSALVADQFVPKSLPFVLMGDAGNMFEVVPALQKTKLKTEKKSN